MLTSWKKAVDGYGGNRKPGEYAEYELRHPDLKVYSDRGYPNRHCRWRLLEKNLFQVELWLENNVKSKGVLGKAITKLVARYTLLRLSNKDGAIFLPHGRAECWYWNGKLRSVYEHDAKTVNKDQYNNRSAKLLYYVEYTATGKLEEFYDERRGEGKAREVKFVYEADGCKVAKWRGKFHLKERQYGGGWHVTRNVNGKPLDDKGDFTVSKYDEKGRKLEEENYVAGTQHGFTRVFNSFGRLISEKYFVRGKEVPDWIYLDPKGVTPEEIQAEDDEELRAIMLELQGTELYQIRSMARGMRAVARTRLACEDAELSAELLAVRRPELVEAKK